MRIRTIIGILIVVSLLVLAACARQQTGAAVACTYPYTVKGTGCCLDKNENKVCDEEEATKVTAVVKDRPVVIYEEVCDATSRFVCLDKQITQNHVKLRLRFDRGNEIVKVKKIELPELQCQQVFEQPGLEYNSVQEFVIPCLIEKEIVKSKLIMHAEVQNYLRYSNGQVYELTQPREFTFAGMVSGFVRPES